jgi:hypothetical protein
MTLNIYIMDSIIGVAQSVIYSDNNSDVSKVHAVPRRRVSDCLQRSSQPNVTIGLTAFVWLPDLYHYVSNRTQPLMKWNFLILGYVLKAIMK